MLYLVLATAFAFFHLEELHKENLQDCNCNWIHIPGACQTPDGTYCWKVCCGGSAPVPSPTPSPGPTPPVGPGKPVGLVQEYYHEGRTNGWFSLGEEHQKNLTGLPNGFSRTGSMRYHSAERMNLLGGGITFTVDLSGVQNLVNANMYLVIPGTLDGGSHFYCDNSQNFVNKHNACIELDIMESDGHSLAATTMHTHIGTNSGCDTWGCRQLVYFGSVIDGNKPFQVDVQVSSDGNIQVYFKQDGKQATAFNSPSGWDQNAKNAVVDGMKNHGCVVVSSQWTGWVPPNTSGTGNLAGSHYVLSNMMYRGSSNGPTN